MDFSIFKPGFEEYLQKINGKSGNSSFFLNSKEFKNYLSEELDIDTSIFSIDVSEILKMDIVNGKLVSNSEENSDSFEHENNDDSINNYDTVDLINNLLKDSSVKQVIDVNTDGNLSNDEILNFVSTISGLDGNKDNVTFDDLLNSIDLIKSNNFSISSGISLDTSSIDYSSQSVSTASGAISGGFSPFSGYSSVGTGINKKDLKFMTKEQLQTELTSAEEVLSEKEAVLASVIDGSNPQLQSLQINVDNLYELYQQQLELVDVTLAKKVDDKKSQIDSKKSDISAKESEITTQEGVVSSAEASYNNAVATRQSLEAALHSLQSTPYQSAEQQASIVAAMNALQAQISAAQQAEEAALKNWENEKATLAKLNSEKDQLNSELDGLNSEMDEIEATIAKEYPKVEQYMNNYNKAQDSYDNTKENMKTAAQSDVNAAREYINNISLSISKKEDKEHLNDIGVDSMSRYNEEIGLELAQAAMTTRGTQGWCLAGVNDTLEEVYGVRLEYRSAYMAADALRGNDPQYADLASHFVEVTDIPLNELRNLPPGAIVVWGNNGSKDGGAGEHGHISVSLGDGRESSDCIRVQYEMSYLPYTVFLPTS